MSFGRKWGIIMFMSMEYFTLLEEVGNTAVLCGVSNYGSDSQLVQVMQFSFGLGKQYSVYA